ncbi:hypothetical protein QUB63_17585 [Microcoleus sp. ARI1-B5]|uniref:hypothetical protein n=1 Tax=unclassified Microcoleus TaxID=2642155 RepID=UPI002FD23EDE
MLIIKEKIFIDANTGSYLGGARGRSGTLDRKKPRTTVPLPYTFAPDPRRLHVFSAEAFVAPELGREFGRR